MSGDAPLHLMIQTLPGRESTEYLRADGPMAVQARGLVAIWFAFMRLEGDPTALRAEVQRILGDVAEEGG
jgi:hypothetical protein